MWCRLYIGYRSCFYPGCVYNPDARSGTVKPQEAQALDSPVGDYVEQAELMGLIMAQNDVLLLTNTK